MTNVSSTSKFICDVKGHTFPSDHGKYPYLDNNLIWRTICLVCKKTFHWGKWAKWYDGEVNWKLDEETI